MKKYTETHEWLEFDKESVVTIGITDAAQKELGEIVFVELPKPGSKVKIDDEVAVLESTKAATDLYAPLSGEVTEINEKLLAEPSLINSSAEKQGWLYKLRLSQPAEIEKLISTDENRAE